MEEILLRPKELRKELNTMLERRESLESACQRVTVRYGTQRVHGGSVDRESVLAALADCNTEIEEQKAKLAAAEQEADAILNRFADASPLRIGHRDAELLRLWCLQQLPFKEIQSEMARKGFPVATGKTLRKWYSDALERFEQFGREINP